MVPGDIVNLSTSYFSTIPADLFLLSGDAIVNESMLTGESVPVSKVPMKDEDILKWRDDKAENPKCFLYGGTRVVRIRVHTQLKAKVGPPSDSLLAQVNPLKDIDLFE